MATARPRTPTPSHPVQWPPFRRVLVLVEGGRAGAAALALARALVEQEHVGLTVVSLAPQAPSGPRCGGSAAVYNTAVCQTVADELDQARAALGQAAAHATFTMLVEGIDPPLDRWCEASGFDLILLPARRRLLRRHPFAARLRRRTRAEVRVVERV